MSCSTQFGYVQCTSPSPRLSRKSFHQAGLDGAALIAQASQSDCKAELRKQTDQAIADGVFGVPTMTVGTELFWGYDDLPFLQRFLDGADPVDSTSWARTSASLQSSATRSRVS